MTFRRILLLPVALLLLCGCSGKNEVDLYQVGAKVSENGLAHTALDHYMGVSLYHAMADFALASGKQEDMDRVMDILLKIKKGEIVMSYTTFWDYTIGGQAAALLAYKGQQELVDEVKRCASEMWERQARTSFDIMTSAAYGPRDAYWIDIAFTVTPFFLYAGLLENNQTYIDYAAYEALRMCSDLYDPESGLYHQGYNHIRCQGISQDCWSRGNGWMSMALGALLRDYPKDGKYWRQIVDESMRFYDAVCKWQDPDGMWHQEMTDFTSYVETSGSGQVLAGLGAAIEAGVLPREKYLPVFEKGLKALLEYVDPDGGVGHCCRGNCVPGKGTKEDFKRMHFYYNENHSFGPVVLAIAQALKLGIKTLTLDAPMGSANDPDRPRAYARVITEHQDNVAWENDRVAFRVYSQQAPNKAASGVDFWAKSVDRPIIDEWYGKEAAGGSYQVDSGSGCDFYNMGVNRGIGGTGIWNGDTLVCPQVYRTVKMENQGPELLSFILDYAPYEAFGRTIQEEKRIEMICGTSFYKVSHTIVTSDGKDAVLGVGIGDFGSPEILVAEDGKLFVSEKVHHKTRVGIGSHDQDCDYFDSEIGGAVIANPSSSAGTAVCGHNQLQLIKVPSGQTVTYYVGADWTFQQNSGRWPGGKKFWTMCAQNETFAGLSRKYLKAGAFAEIVTRPTFNNCSVKLEPDFPDAVLEYRKAKGKWSTAPDFKGSLMGLDEDTRYEVRYMLDGEVISTAAFRTWASEVKVAKVVEIDPDKYEAPLVIADKGTPDAWVRYTVKGGTLVNPTDKETIIFDGAQYVLLDDMTIRGAHGCTRSILVKDGKAVRIRNCDIAGWGREGVQNFQYLPYERRFGAGNGSYVDKNGAPINLDPAIEIGDGASEVVVERCFIHDPVSRAVSWYYHHPEGPNAVLMGRPKHSTVLRYNDFIGSDRHLWNDAVEGLDNFEENGGFNRDADIYGNFMIFANDDCIELDGGQQNVRCYENRFEGALVGVSVQGCMVGPSFVFNNWFTGMDEEFDIYGQTVKTGGGVHGKDTYSYIYDNVFWGDGTGISERANFGTIVYGNKFCGSQTIKKNTASTRSCDYDNEFGVDIAEEDIDSSYPKRPLPFTLSRARVSVGLSREPVVIDIAGKLPKNCDIRKPDACDWFDVKLENKKLVIYFDDSKMNQRRKYRGAFVLRTSEGLSRPVSIYAETSFVPSLRPSKPGVFAQYIDGFSLKSGENKTVSFTLEKSGRYWIMLHGKIEKPVNDFEIWQSRPHALAGVDGQALEKISLQMFDYPTWSMMNPGGNLYSFVRHYDLKAGRHTIHIDSSDDPGKYYFDDIAITDDPAAFEPNRVD